MRRRRLIASVIATAAVVLGGGLALSGSAPADAAGSLVVTRSVTITPSSTLTSWTVPSALTGAVRVSISGAPGRGDQGGAGASFGFSTTAFTAGTVLDVRFGPGRDGLFPALSAAAGGTGSSAVQSGTAGGDATMIVARATGDVCLDSPGNVVAVAGGGGGASGSYTNRDTWLTKLIIADDRTTPVAPGENSTSWDAGGPATVRAACGPGSGARAGESAAQSWYSRLTAGGGGGGGLTAGTGGAAQRWDTTVAESKKLFGNITRATYQEMVTPSTGGRAGTSYLAAGVCGGSCAAPAIVANRGAASVTFTWNELVRTRVAVYGLSDAGGLYVTDTIKGDVEVVDANSATPRATGTVAAWLGDTKIAESRIDPSNGRYALAAFDALPQSSFAQLRIVFTPDDTANYQGSSANIIARQQVTTPWFVMTSVTDTDGSQWLVVRMKAAFSTGAPKRPALTIRTRAEGASSDTDRGTVPTTTDDVTSCAALSLTTTTPQQVTVSFAGDRNNRPSSSAAFRYVPGTAAAGASQLAGCSRTALDLGASVRPAAFARSASFAPAAVPTAASAELSWVSPDGTVPAGDATELVVDVTHDGVETDEGAVEFFVDGESVGVAPASGNGRFALTVPTPDSGAHVLDAVYTDPADDTGEASQAGGAAPSRALTVSPGTFALSLSAVRIDPVAQGGAVTLRAQAASHVEGARVSGDILFFDDERYLGEAPLDGGTAELADVVFDGVANTAYAVFVTDDGGWISPEPASAPVDYPVSPTSLTLGVPAGPLTADDAGVVRVELSGSSASGAAALHAGDELLLDLDEATAVAPSEGASAAWEVPVAELPVGDYVLSAVFVGDPGVGGSRSEGIPVSVRPRATTTGASLDGTTLSITASVAQHGIVADAVSAGPWGFAEVYAGDTLLGVAVVVDGTAQATVPADTAVRVVFHPVSGDLAESQASVAPSLARTGTADSWPALAGAAALLLATGVGLLCARRRAAR